MDTRAAEHDILQWATSSISSKRLSEEGQVIMKKKNWTSRGTRTAHKLSRDPSCQLSNDDFCKRQKQHSDTASCKQYHSSVLYKPPRGNIVSTGYEVGETPVDMVSGTKYHADTQHLPGMP